MLPKVAHTFPLLPARLLAPPALHWGVFQAADGAALRYAYIAGKDARAACVMVGGFSEFAEKYFETMHDLIAAGFAVWFLDWRGQGGSERPATHPTRPRARDYAQDAADLAAFTETHLPEHGRRIVVAHSMGAAIAMLCLTKYPRTFDAAVLSAPMLGIMTGSIPQAVARVITRLGTLCGLGAHFAPGRGPWRSDPQIAANSLTTHDPLRATIQQAWFTAQPALRVDGPTFGWVDAAFRFMRELNDPAVLRQVTVPVLIGCPDQEAFVDPAATLRAAAHMPDCTLLEFPGARHELFSETDDIRGRWLDAVLRFMRAHVDLHLACPAS